MRRLKKPATPVAQPQQVEPRQTVEDLVKRFERLSLHDRWLARLALRQFIVLMEPPKFDPHEFEGQPPRPQRASGDEPWNEEIPARMPSLTILHTKPLSQVDRLEFNLARRWQKKAKAKG